jgi:mRNA-degrading endonuclease RelE of RelBE toxin-antitoxin system
VFRIRLSRGALQDLRSLRAHDRARVVAELERQLTQHALEASPDRKQLSAVVPLWEHVPPVWELRIGEYRVFYDVDGAAGLVPVRAIRQQGRRTTKEIL